MRIKLLLIAAVLLVAACNDNDDVPSGILNQQKMQKVFWELTQADVYVNEVIRKDTVRNKNLNQESISLQKKIFKLNNISKEDFYRSYDYYKNHPDKMKVILDSISAVADREREKIIKRDTVPVLKEVKKLSSDSLLFRKRLRRKI